MKTFFFCFSLLFVFSLLGVQSIAQDKIQKYETKIKTVIIKNGDTTITEKIIQEKPEKIQKKVVITDEKNYILNNETVDQDSTIKVYKFKSGDGNIKWVEKSISGRDKIFHIELFDDSILSNFDRLNLDTVFLPGGSKIILRSKIFDDSFLKERDFDIKIEGDSSFSKTKKLYFKRFDRDFEFPRGEFEDIIISKSTLKQVSIMDVEDYGIVKDLTVDTTQTLINISLTPTKKKHQIILKNENGKDVYFGEFKTKNEYYSISFKIKDLEKGSYILTIIQGKYYSKKRINIL